MINDIILLKQGEIVLKGLNRRSFEQKLMSNIKRRLAAIGKFKVYCMQSTVYIEPVDETSDMDAAFEAMTKVFGLASVNRAAGCEKDAKRIAELAIEYEMGRSGRSREEIWNDMADSLEVMKNSARACIEEPIEPLYGYEVGDCGKKMMKAYNEGKLLGGSILPKSLPSL